MLICLKKLKVFLKLNISRLEIENCFEYTYKKSNLERSGTSFNSSTGL
jgi:hypothetical protein